MVEDGTCSFADTLVQELAQEYAADLELLLQYDSADYTSVIHDLEESDGEQLQQIVNELRLERVESQYQEQLHNAGELECVLRLFEETIQCHVQATDSTGVFASLESDRGSLALLRSILTAHHESASSDAAYLLRCALQELDDEDVTYHLRQALQILTIEDTLDERQA